MVEKRAGPGLGGTDACLLPMPSLFRPIRFCLFLHLIRTCRRTYPGMRSFGFIPLGGLTCSSILLVVGSGPPSQPLRHPLHVREVRLEPS